MITEDHETPNGWPLGLERMSMRLRVAESLLAAAAAAAEPNSLHAHSSSFSSFSSSNLDTEVNQSTASFFQDHSVPLGRLIGIQPGDRGSLYFPNSVRFQQHETISKRRSFSDVSHRHGMELSRGICVPQLRNIMVKMSRSKSTSRH